MKMKRLLILGIIISNLSVLNAHAFMESKELDQENIYYNQNDYQQDRKNTRLGVFLAPSVDWMSSKSTKGAVSKFNTESFGSAAGFKFGLTINKQLNSWLTINTGLQYNFTSGNLLTRNQSNLSTQTNIISMADMYYKLSYLELPLHFQYVSPEIIEHLRLFGGVGVGLGIAMNKQVSMNLDYYDKNGIRHSYQQDYEALKGWTKNVAPITLFGDVGIGAQYDVDYKRTVYFGVYYQNMFLPDLTRHSKFNFPEAGQVEFNDGNVSAQHVSFKLGILF